MAVIRTEAPLGQRQETRVADPLSGVRKIGIDMKFMPE